MKDTITKALEDWWFIMQTTGDPHAKRLALFYLDLEECIQGKNPVN